MGRRLFATPSGIAFWVGLVALVAGVVVALTAPTASFGWFAYAPVSDDAFVAGTDSTQQAVGQLLAVAGAVVAAFALGRLSVRRRS
ncbi:MULTISPECIES: hypothetical protein [unclassified Curtobacterium]|uniref:hypothetical protein n=1 Tax=unclassified Curtobacterium TaxID=257496 RepID=UPI0008DD1684|nr:MULTISPECIES: hypothetical protein [unclassified Curtobacterium]OIH99837.1 hypothetical protein BIU92_02945 [Curtobacterium sp. MCBA15_003]OII11763.1 hypothetical protein BIU97_07860 [Curtobacterium sp. MCBA15_009]OII32749.1 hypothetical protein BIU94_16570 [Curtobacterium sp. MMLR14_006]